MVDRKSVGRKILWWGAAQAEYAWLQQRVASYQSPLTAHVELKTVEQPLDQICGHIEERPFDRMIIAFPNRWDYSARQLQQLILEFPEIPVALAVGDWWLGWRRTGIGHLQNLPHLSLPWYRWWDGWVHWLDGTMPNMFGPFPSDRCSVDILGRWLSPHCFIEAPVAGALKSTVQNAEQSCVFASRHPDSANWIQWDDSRLSTWLGREQSIAQAIEQLIRLQAENPLAKLWIAWTLPTWEVVERLTQAGLRFELLAKPSCWPSPTL